MLVVSNTTPLIALAKIGQLEILYCLFKKVVIPDKVYQEITTNNLSGALEVKNAKWISVEKITDELKVELLSVYLDQGESEALILALEKRANLFLVDEKKARNIAKMLGLKVKGTLGILAQAYKQNLISDFKRELDKLRSLGVWINDDLYKKVLDIVGYCGGKNKNKLIVC